MKEARRRTKALLAEAAAIQPGERKCKARVKLRDEAGNYLRDEGGNVQSRPCKNNSIRGGFVCPRHGGKAPQVKAKAERRLRAMLEPSLIRLEELAHQNSHLPTALGAVLAIQNRVLGQVGKEAGEKDTRPIINIGIRVGGVPMPGISQRVSVQLPAPAADVAEGEVVGDDDDTD